MELINAIEYTAVTPSRYWKFQKTTARELSVLLTVVLEGWPDTKAQVKPAAREYWNYRDELAVHDGVIFKGMRIVIPPSERPEMLRQIHSPHMGIVKCKQ